MKKNMRMKIPILGMLAIQIFFFSGSANGAQAIELLKAIADGKVIALFSGTGSSSGDAIIVSVSKTDKAGPGILSLMITPGTRLRSSAASEQSMVIAGVQGRVVGETSFEPTSVIEVSTSETKEYVLEAYCAEFDKDNPSASNSFTLTNPDPILACLLRETTQLSIAAKQAAIWIHTDRVTFEHMNEKFSISNSEWLEAQAAVKRCL